MRHIPAQLVSSLLFLSVCCVASAKQSDFKEPINVTSNKQVAELSDNKVTFLEDVVITQGTILIHADKVVVTRDASGEVNQVTAYGNTATFDQVMDNNKPIHAEALTITYYVKKQDIVLTSKAFIQQENSKLSSDKITYNIERERMEAESGKTQGGRVTTVFIPDQLKTQINDSKKTNKKF